jgi:hypothetical protein
VPHAAAPSSPAPLSVPDTGRVQLALAGSAVPAALARSVELQGACPTTATAMLRDGTTARQVEVLPRLDLNQEPFD